MILYTSVTTPKTGEHIGTPYTVEMGSLAPVAVITFAGGTATVDIEGRNGAEDGWVPLVTIDDSTSTFVSLPAVRQYRVHLTGATGAEIVVSLSCSRGWVAG